MLNSMKKVTYYNLCFYFYSCLSVHSENIVVSLKFLSTGILLQNEVGNSDRKVRPFSFVSFNRKDLTSFPLCEHVCQSLLLQKLT